MFFYCSFIYPFRVKFAANLHIIIERREEKNTFLTLYAFFHFFFSFMVTTKFASVRFAGQRFENMSHGLHGGVQ